MGITCCQILLFVFLQVVLLGHLIGVIVLKRPFPVTTQCVSIRPGYVMERMTVEMEVTKQQNSVVSIVLEKKTKL